MDKIVDAAYDGEVFRPDEPMDLSANTKVKIHIKDEKDKAETPKKRKGKPYSSLEYGIVKTGRTKRLFKEY